MNVTDGQTSFSYFSLVSVQSHTVSKSVRPYGGSGAKKKLTDKQTDKHTDPIEVIHSMAKNLLLNFIHERICSNY
jgi:hypothetical protein